MYVNWWLQALRTPWDLLEFDCWSCWMNWCVFHSYASIRPSISPQSGLHSEVCEIDQKLHAIVAGRKRCTLQTIHEETGTNIYLPSPLQGLVGPDPATSGGANLGNTRNQIWITGEFFGVQRARDMLYQVSLTKVRSRFLCASVSEP